MNLRKIEAVAQTEMGARQDNPAREPGWILYHGKRTGKIACKLRNLLRLQTDLDTLYIAGLFHDIGKGKENHHEAGAEQTRSLLVDQVPEGTLDTVCETIALHNQRKKSKVFTEYTKLIQDADLLDHVGYIDIWLSFYYTGHSGQTIHDHMTWVNGKDNRRYRKYMRTHLNYDLSKKILEKQIRFSDTFFKDFHRVYFEGM
jgi:uncharacterized protein